MTATSATARLLDRHGTASLMAQRSSDARDSRQRCEWRGNRGRGRGTIAIAIAAAAPTHLAPRTLATHTTMATVKKQINVPKDVHRHIIGAAGAVIRELQTTHSVKYVLLDDRALDILDRALAVLASWISSPARSPY